MDNDKYATRDRDEKHQRSYHRDLDHHERSRESHRRSDHKSSSSRRDERERCFGSRYRVAWKNASEDNQQGAEETAHSASSG
ncbi:hypothetical protein COLO4_37364 [Corchorus olitorius]|uniref:Uncharacterized protein n=1 Tax=Corchorus olitorius TaxID=93759 RepID=A0A1R3G276_9ROSI|nr:hypothetical protein COLO4_37364 [Corchorus olitorius]